MANKVFMFCCVVITICCCVSPSLAQTQTCNSYTFSSPKNTVFKSCSDLPVLSSFLHWTFFPTTLTADIAFRKTGTSTNSWVVWSLNPTAQTMLGSQALVAFHNSAGVPTAYTTQINSYSPTMQNGSLTFGVSNIRAEYSNGDMIIFATLHLNNELIKTNQIWQEGPMSVTGFGMHPMGAANLRSVATIDFSTGAIAPASGSGSAPSNRFKNIHGILNAVSWGIMMPIGIMMARYLKVFQVANPAWFYLHAVCQTSAYLIGVAGLATGIKLGTRSPGITHNNHRILGITLFCCATLQVFALLLRPKPDHKYRLYWNIYHRSVGYATVAMSIINVYKGLHILQPDHKWKIIYTAILISLGAVAALLEVVTWVIVLCRKNQDGQEYPNPRISTERVQAI